MKRPLSILGATVLLVQAVLAQATIELELDQKQYLPGERILAKVRVGNYSGQVLNFGTTADWLTFEVQSSDGLIVERRESPAVLGEFNLDSSSIATKRVNLAPAFNVTRPGHYRVTATVHVAAWDQRWASKVASFDVIKGTTIWEREFGLTNAAGGPPVMHKFALVEARYLDRPTLYARLSDAAEREVIAVRPIGVKLSFNQPEGQIDRRNRLHVLWQDGARTYSYVILGPGGDLAVRQTFQVTTTRPALRPLGEQDIQVVGGQRVVTSNDLPAPSTAAATP